MEPLLYQRFMEHREAGAVVLRCHLLVFICEICQDLGIDLEEMKRVRGWRNMKVNLQKRVREFCLKHKICMKRASRQLHKDPRVIICSLRNT